MRVITDQQWAMIPQELRDKINPPVEKQDNKKLMAKQFSIVRDFNVLIGLHALKGDGLLFFGDDNPHWFEWVDVFDLLVQAGCFTSKNEARKNWKGIQKIPEGYFEIGPIGKSKVMIFGLNAVIDEPKCLLCEHEIQHSNCDFGW